MPQTVLTVQHNIEVAHRIHNLPGKCTNIHGHSMWVVMTVSGVPYNGILHDSKTHESLSFTRVKEIFRGFLDEEYDHGLLLNIDDPMYQILQRSSIKIKTFQGPPSTENIALDIFSAMRQYFDVQTIQVQETHVNGVLLRGDNASS